MRRARVLLFSSALLALAVGLAVAGLGAALPPDEPGATALLVGGLVTAAVGLHAIIVWAGLPGDRHARARQWLDEADAHARAGRFDYARTFYEEALRAGADPEDIVPRLALMEARAARRS